MLIALAAFAIAVERVMNATTTR